MWFPFKKKKEKVEKTRINKHTLSKEKILIIESLIETLKTMIKQINAHLEAKETSSDGFFNNMRENHRVLSKYKIEIRKLFPREQASQYNELREASRRALLNATFTKKLRKKSANFQRLLEVVLKADS